MTIPVRTTKTTPIRVDKNVSYVVLDNGDSVGGDMRKRDPLFSQSKFEFGDSTYKAKEVTFYQHKGNRYMNVGGKEFAEQVVAGPINVYERTIILPSGGAGMGGRTWGLPQIWAVFQVCLVPEWEAFPEAQRVARQKKFLTFKQVVLTSPWCE
ncbi:MAG: hypothetical protein EOP52_01350 [Sphingobacteriales bacterium]|nr:MAG: hypothetical protein EOP52_01350 [Sphingobacteriales bacterium]